MECEYADNDYLVLMITPKNKEEELKQLVEVLKNLSYYKQEVISFPIEKKKVPVLKSAKKVMSVREAFFSLGEVVAVEQSVGKICRMPTATCPPAIPIVVPGEQMDEVAIQCFQYYGIELIEIIKN